MQEICRSSNSIAGVLAHKNKNNALESKRKTGFDRKIDIYRQDEQNEEKNKIQHKKYLN